MTDLDDVVDVPTAAAILGIRSDSCMGLLVRGSISPSRRFGGPRRGFWITTRDAVARYQAVKDTRRRAK